MNWKEKKKVGVREVMLNTISAKGSMRVKVPACGSCPVGLETVLQCGGFPLCKRGNLGEVSADQWQQRYVDRLA